MEYTAEPAAGKPQDRESGANHFEITGNSGEPPRLGTDESSPGSRERFSPERLPPALKELTKLRAWVLWKWVERDGKKTKPPFQPNGKPAKSNDPSTWSTYEDVIRAYRAGGFDGIGIATGVEHPDGSGRKLAAVDLDHCRDG